VLKVNIADLLVVLLVSLVMMLLFDLPMQEVKNIVFGSGKSSMLNDMSWCHSPKILIQIKNT
jgi:hypothetical protein